MYIYIYISIWAHMMQLQEGCQGRGAGQWCRSGVRLLVVEGVDTVLPQAKKDSSMMRTNPEPSLHMMHPRIILAMGWQA